MHTPLPRGRLAYSILLAFASLQCGGAEFTTDDGSNDFDADAAGSPALSSGGDATGAGAAATSPSGNFGGQGGADGDAPMGAPAGAGVDNGPRIKLELADCGADAFGSAMKPLLYSTLDSAPAITEPDIGEQGFVGNEETDYHQGRCATGANIDQPSDYIKFHYQDSGVRQFDPLIGTIDFWYRPSFAHTDGLEHHLFGTANFGAVGGIRMSKTDAKGGNALVVTFRSPQVGDLKIEVPAHGYQLDAGEWARITLVWYLGPDLPQRYTRLFVDGALVGEALPAIAFQMAPDPNGHFMLGVWNVDDSQHAAGLFDDLKVFARGP